MTSIPYHLTQEWKDAVEAVKSSARSRARLEDLNQHFNTAIAGLRKLAAGDWIFAVTLGDEEVSGPQYDELRLIYAAEFTREYLSAWQERQREKGRGE